MGPYLLSELERRKSRAIELHEKIDITDSVAIRNEVARFLALIPRDEKAVIFHLAALSHVGKSWSGPAEVISVNVGGTANILAGLAELGFRGRFVYVSSAEVYGNQPQVDAINEAHPTLPLSPYAASKLAAEVFVQQVHRAHALDTVIARPFNHIGPGQSESFLVSAIARRITEAVRVGSPTIEVGNLGAIRDFLDVRDVVRAYCDLAETALSGETYNISSGAGRSVAEVVKEMIRLSGARLEVSVNPGLTRAIEVPRLVGDCTKLQEATGFRPLHSLEATLGDVLQYWRGRPGV